MTTPAPLSEYFYLYSSTGCIAKPNKGFEFVSWQENLKNNSTQIIKFSYSNSSTIFEDIANSLHNMIIYLGLGNIFGISDTVKAESILNVTKFGTFTANFKELPPPLPPEYWATLFGVVVTALIGSWLVPTIIGWGKAKKHQKKLNEFQLDIKKLYNDDKLDKDDISNLNKLRENVVSGYTRGDITKDQYNVLLNNISIRYNEIVQNEINLATNEIVNENKIKLINEIQSALDVAYLKEKINDKHYNLLKEKISELEKKS